MQNLFHLGSKIFFLETVGSEEKLLKNYRDIKWLGYNTEQYLSAENNLLISDTSHVTPVLISFENL